MMRAARKRIGLSTDETIIIGDTMDTDILGGIQVGYHTVLTLSGVSKRAQVENYAFSPDRIINSLADVDPEELIETLEANSGL
jgi:NagD protein